MIFNAIVSDIRLVSRQGGVTRWQILLDTHDIPASATPGTLTAKSASGAVLIAEILSVVREEAGQVWMVTEKPLPIGTEVEVTLRG
jgi:hypothetical protein